MPENPTQNMPAPAVLPSQPAAPVTPVTASDIPNTPPSGSAPPVEDETVEEGPVYKQWGFWITLFLLLNLIVFAYLWIIPLFSPLIVVKDQPIQASFRVSKVKVLEAGFVAIQSDIQGVPGPVLGFSNFLIPDTYSEFDISLLSPDQLPPEVLQSIIPGTKAYATLYIDSDKDGNFLPTSDNQISKDILGRKIQTFFIIQSLP
jgi:hypothetical protein